MKARHACLACLLAIALPADPLQAEQARIRFDIPQQSADAALLVFARQAEIPLLLPRASLSRLTANPVRGEYLPETALDLLLEDTGVHAFIDEGAHQLVVQLPEEEPTDGEDSAAGDQSLYQVLSGWLQSVFTADQTLREDSDSYDRSERLEEITVTGSRIRNLTGMTTATPVTSVTDNELFSFKPENTVAEQLDVLPQFFNTQTAQRGGTTFIDAGASYLNLRGMGPNRTLVQLDGSRVVPADSFGNVNVDNLPMGLIQSVDIVTGGASAAYGADAIAGVVNFKLDREFEGYRARLSSGTTEAGGGTNWNISLAGGIELSDRLHVIGSLDSRYIHEIKPDPDRLDNFQRWGWVSNPEWYRGAPRGIPQRLVLPQVHNTGFSPQGLILQPGFSYHRYTFTDDGRDVRPYELGDFNSPGGKGATYTQSGGPEFATHHRAFDGGPQGREVIQRNVFGAFDYFVNKDFKLFAQGLVGRTESNAYGRRGNPALHSIWSGTVYRENPFLPERVRAAMEAEGLDSLTVAKRGTVYGPEYSNWYADRDDRNISRSASVTLGFEAALAGDWNLRLSHQWGSSRLTSAANNIVRLDKFFTAMDAVPDPETGNAVCNVALHDPTAAELKASVEGERFSSPLSLEGIAVDSPIGPMDPLECVPINIFGLGNVSASARDWVEDPEKKNVRNLRQDFTELILSRDFHPGVGAGPLAFAGGITYRHESFAQYSLPAYGERNLRNAPEFGIRGIPPGFTGPGNRELHQFSGMGAGAGSFSVAEWFSEINLPLWESAGGKSLGMNLGFRRSDYSTSGLISSWKLGLDFQVTDDLRWRLTRSRDVREPNFSEQFVTGSGGTAISDPAMNGNYYLVTSFTGPNRQLQTEKADTITTGLIYQPDFAEWAEGLQLSVDWYKIRLSQAVSKWGAQRIVDECFQNARSPLCELVTRNEQTDAVDRIVDKYFNVGGANTEGVDLEVRYAMDLNFLDDWPESLRLRGLAGYLKDSSASVPGGRMVNAVGDRNIPRWTANLSLNYQAGPFGIHVAQRYYHSTKLNPGWVEGVDIDDNSIASQSVTNLSLMYQDSMGESGTWEMAFNVNNLFDREPPIIPHVNPGGGSQAINNSFDIFGRRYQLSLRVEF